MQHLIHSTTGLIHLVAACLAMLLGALVMYLPKGTTRHKKIGYVYGVAMLAVNITAFMIYQLWGRFAIFHWFAVLSLASLLAGMLPMFLFKKRSAALALHLSFMYWSVVGLYCAFVAEVLVRVPHELFRGNFSLAINASIFSLMTVGGVLFGYYKRKWHKQFGVD